MDNRSIVAICVGAATGILIIAGAFAVQMRGGSTQPVVTASAESSARMGTANARPPAPPPKQPTRAERVRGADDLAEAIREVKPALDDASGKYDPGAALFADWASRKLLWGDLAKYERRTTVPKAFKDIRSERGKVACASGSIIEIEADHSLSKPVFHGGMTTNSGNVVRFTAVGRTGDIVANSRAKFCGLVAGRFDYTNTIGGQTRSVLLIGMFAGQGN